MVDKLLQSYAAKRGRKPRTPKPVMDALTGNGLPSKGGHGGKRTNPLTPRVRELIRSMATSPALPTADHAKAAGLSPRGARAAIAKAEVRQALREAIIENFGITGLPLAGQRMVNLIDNADSDRVKYEAAKFTLEAHGVGPIRASAANTGTGIRLNLVVRNTASLPPGAETQPPEESGVWFSVASGPAPDRVDDAVTIPESAP